jgi:hypothetical protein
LIAGPTVIICDECVELYVNFITEESAIDKIVSPLWPEQIGDRLISRTVLVRDLSSEELTEALERGKKGVERNRRALQAIGRRLAMRESEDLHGDDLLALPELAYLRNKSRDELVALQRTAQVQLNRYEEGVRIASTVLAERGQRTR